MTKNTNRGAKRLLAVIADVGNRTGDQSVAAGEIAEMSVAVKDDGLQHPAVRGGFDDAVGIAPEQRTVFAAGDALKMQWINPVAQYVAVPPEFTEMLRSVKLVAAATPRLHLAGDVVDPMEVGFPPHVFAGFCVKRRHRLKGGIGNKHVGAPAVGGIFG